MFFFIYKGRCKVVPVHAVRTHGGLELWLHMFLFFELDGGERPVSCHGSFTPWGTCSQHALNRSYKLR